MDEAELTVRLIMDHKEACQVLGRAGCNIKTLRDETGSKIMLSNKEHKKRVLSITDKKKQVMKAVGRLSEILESEVNSYGASSRLVPISLTLVLPKNICGIIVGKKGETIKELRVQSGAQIVLAAEVYYTNTRIHLIFYPSSAYPNATSARARSPATTLQSSPLSTSSSGRSLKRRSKRARES